MNNPLLNLANYYKQIFTDTKPQFKLTVKWLIVSATIGAVVFFVYPQLLEQIIALFDDEFGSNPGLDMKLAMDIFLNNVRVAMLAIFGGIIFGIGSFMVVATNGFILGFIILTMFLAITEKLSDSLLFVAVGIIPHGILEIPAFLLAAAIGLKLGLEWLKTESYGHRWQVFRDNLKLAVFKGVPVIVVTLFVAALIEVYVSGKLLDSLIP